MTAPPGKARVHVLFPVYNEGSAAAALARRLGTACEPLGRPFRLVAVDDGSKDGSGALLLALASALPLTVLTHPENQGLAAALHTGLAALARDGPDGDDIVVTMDGDDTHDPACLPAMLGAVEAGADVAIASRFRKGATTLGVPASRRILSLVASLFGRLALGVPGVRDYTCGYRAFRASLLARALPAYEERLPELKDAGFACSLALLLAFAGAGARFAEVPLALRYDRKECPSKLPATRTILGTLRLIASWRLRRP